MLDLDRDDSCRDLLLMCGVCVDPDSYLAVRAFRLVEGLLYAGDDGAFADPRAQQKLADWAHHVAFAKHPSARDLAGFPVFWKCRIPSLPPPQPYDIAVFELITDDPEAHEFHAIRRNPAEGVTPLEFYAPLLLDDPPISTHLVQRALFCLAYWDALRASRVRAGRPPSFDVQRELLDMDMVAVDFFRAPADRWNVAEAIVRRLPRHVVLRGNQPVHVSAEGPDAAGRAPINGGIAGLALFFKNASLLTCGENRYFLIFAQDDDKVGEIRRNQGGEPAALFASMDAAVNAIGLLEDIAEDFGRNADSGETRAALGVPVVNDSPSLVDAADLPDYPSLRRSYTPH
jgi:hypothetical protein